MSANLRTIRARIILIVVGLIMIPLWYFAIGSYFARYNFVTAKYGNHSVDEYERRLKQSLEHDPAFGYANLEIAALMIRRAKYGAALEYQEKAMESFRPIDAYHQMAGIQERLGHLDAARDYYEMAARMKPGNILAMERLANLAYNAKDAGKLDELSRDIFHADPEDVNALYLLARQAERDRNWEAAYLNYERILIILSRDTPGKTRDGMFFQRDDVISRVTELSRRISR